MTVFSFRTLQHAGTGLYKEKGSKFMAFAYPVEDESSVRQKIEGLKKDYYDARHHCYAYVLGPEKKNYRAYDDGEPNHSAGDPILGQIRSKDLTNVLIVVVRYFGGTKLGVGGLIAAYKAAAEDALNHCTIIEQEVVEQLDLRCDYVTIPEVMRLIKELDLQIAAQEYGVSGKLILTVPLRIKEKLLARVAFLKNTGHVIDIL